MQIRERLSLKISVQIFHKKFYTQTAEDSFTNKKTCTIENKCTYKEGSLSKVIELIGVFGGLGLPSFPIAHITKHLFALLCNCFLLRINSTDNLCDVLTCIGLIDCNGFDGKMSKPERCYCQ